MQAVDIIASVADDKPGCNDEIVFLLADRVTLAKRRWRGVAQDGREFGFDLDHRLSDGAVFHRESGKCYVISQTPESVLEIALGSDPSRAAVISWQIGNLHFPVEITDEVIRCADDPAIRLLLSRERVSLAPCYGSFSPNHLCRAWASSLSKLQIGCPRCCRFLTRRFRPGRMRIPSDSKRWCDRAKFTTKPASSAFLYEHAIPGLTHVDLPLVREARAAAMAGDRADLIAVDQLAAALRVSRELREASLQTGRRRLAILIRLRATPELELLDQISREDARAGHHAIVWGVSCVSIPLRASLEAYYYHCVSCICTAAPKLIRIGQEGSQRVLGACLAETAPRIAQALTISREGIGWFDPLLDIASMRHETADERLFIS